MLLNCIFNIPLKRLLFILLLAGYTIFNVSIGSNLKNLRYIFSNDLNSSKISSENNGISFLVFIVDLLLTNFLKNTTILVNILIKSFSILI